MTISSRSVYFLQLFFLLIFWYWKVRDSNRKKFCLLLAFLKGNNYNFCINVDEFIASINQNVKWCLQGEGDGEKAQNKPNSFCNIVTKLAWKIYKRYLRLVAFLLFFFFIFFSFSHFLDWFFSFIHLYVYVYKLPLIRSFLSIYLLYSFLHLCFSVSFLLSLSLFFILYKVFIRFLSIIYKRTCSTLSFILQVISPHMLKLWLIAEDYNVSMRLTIFVWKAGRRLLT